MSSICSSRRSTGPREAHGAKGIGIGLSVCQRLAEAQDGRIWAQPREGGGSVFSFTVPGVEDPIDMDEPEGGTRRALAPA